MSTDDLKASLLAVIHGRKLDQVEIHKELQKRAKGSGAAWGKWLDSKAVWDALQNLESERKIVSIPQRNGYHLYEVPRRAVPDRDLLAMFICLWRDKEDKPAVDLEWAKTVNAQAIIRAFRKAHQIDHWPVPRAWGGKDHPTNYYPLKTAAHREKTAKKDVKAIAKARRLAKARAEEEQRKEDFRRKVLAKPSAIDQSSTDKPNRPKKAWPRQKMGYRKFDGTPVWPDRNRKG